MTASERPMFSAPMIATVPILHEILDRYTLPIRGDHGVVHWARVLENGLRLAPLTGANVEVVTLFALFHDSRRVNEHTDIGHGYRGAGYARSLRGKLVHLDDVHFELLFEACSLHTDGLTEGDITLQTCWDADRLDLGRVGITPEPELLCTDAARGLLDWAHGRAEMGFEPEFVAGLWGV
jgi:uncharacterized protein